MTPDTLFSYAGTAAMAGWVLLILGPRRFTWFNAIALWVIPAGLSAVYAALVLSRFSGMGGGYDSLDNVAILLSDRWALLAGWIHYLAFDLFIGAVMALRMDRAGISRLVRLCCTNWLRDSLFESSVIVGGHEQLVPYEVSDKELAFI